LNSQGNKASIYVGDCDLSGLRIAVSGGYSYRLLLEYNWLTQRLMKQHYPDSQQKYLVKLEQYCPKGWKQLLMLMGDSGAGLRQQKMYQSSLEMYPRKGFLSFYSYHITAKTSC
jgi:hypothetical protein